MPLEPVPELMRHARRKRYAIGYFESWNLESLHGVMDAAEQTRSPIIIGFNGEFLSQSERATPSRIAWYAGLGRAVAQTATVPCGVLFNECPRDDWSRRAVKAGFNMISVPPDPGLSFDRQVRRVASLAAFAHRQGVAVEAEMDELPCGVAGQVSEEGAGTDPDTAARFVEATGVDLLAVSVGNVHIMVKGRRGLDLERLARIHGRVSIPFALHGGTGIPTGALRKAIALGVAKVNYGTYLKQRYLAAAHAALKCRETNPHQMLGAGGRKDVLVAARHAVRDAVLERIGALGCCRKA